MDGRAKALVVGAAKSANLALGSSAPSLLCSASTLHRASVARHAAIAE
jgi:hypothetical protein